MNYYLIKGTISFIGKEDEFRRTELNSLYALKEPKITQKDLLLMQEGLINLFNQKIPKEDLKEIFSVVIDSIMPLGDLEEEEFFNLPKEEEQEKKE